jgi:UDP-N-acetylmuramoylalanine--D-glutamate ligase
MMIDITGRNILVLGAGKSGISAARFALTKKPGRVILSDVKPRGKLPEEAIALEKLGAVLETDGHSDDSIMHSDIIIISPGIPVDARWNEMIKRHNKTLIGEIEFAYQFCEPYRPKIIAITGTNGKTTVTTLMHEILKGQIGDSAALAGNVGTPFCDLLPDMEKYTHLVLEISSFQLETVRDFKPYISMILNITDDHLDRYQSMQAYAEAKARIFKNQTEREFLLLNSEDKFTNIMVSMAKCSKVFFSAYNILKDGYYVEDGTFIKHVFGKRVPLFKTSEMKLVGKHNQENVLSCLIASDILGLDMKKTADTVRNFKGLHHRIEYSGDINGKKFYDDSKGTNIDAVIKAVQTFDEDMILILGGREKNTDFYQLYDVLPQNVKKIMAFGENREKIKNIFKDKVEVLEALSMEEVVRKCAAAPDVRVVLLSPGCASFDMFKNYEHRGNEFKKFVQKVMRNE